MSKGLTTIRKMLTMMVGATAGGLIQLSFQTPSEPEIPPQEPPINVLPQARSVTHNRLPAASTPPPALLTHPQPERPRRITRFAVRPASAIRSAADEPPMSPSRTAAAPPRDRLKNIIDDGLPSLAPVGSDISRSTCRPLFRRFGRGLRRNRMR